MRAFPFFIEDEKEKERGVGAQRKEQQEGRRREEKRKEDFQQGRWKKGQIEHKTYKKYLLFFLTVRCFVGWLLVVAAAASFVCWCLGILPACIFIFFLLLYHQWKGLTALSV